MTSCWSLRLRTKRSKIGSQNAAGSSASSGVMVLSPRKALSFQLGTGLSLTDNMEQRSEAMLANAPVMMKPIITPGPATSGSGLLSFESPVLLLLILSVFLILDEVGTLRVERLSVEERDSSSLTRQMNWYPCYDRHLSALNTKMVSNYILR